MRGAALIYVSSEPFYSKTEQNVPFPPPWLAIQAVCVRAPPRVCLRQFRPSSESGLLVFIFFYFIFLIVSVLLLAGLQALQLCDVFFLFTANLAVLLKSNYNKEILKKSRETVACFYKILKLFWFAFCHTVMFYLRILVEKKKSHI